MVSPVHWTQISPAQAAVLFPDGAYDPLEREPAVVLPLGEEGVPCPWPWGPQQLAGQPMGMYHCPYCGSMELAGQPHLDYRELLEVLEDLRGHDRAVWDR